MGLQISSLGKIHEVRFQGAFGQAEFEILQTRIETLAKGGAQAFLFRLDGLAWSDEKNRIKVLAFLNTLRGNQIRLALVGIPQAVALGYQSETAGTFEKFQSDADALRWLDPAWTSEDLPRERGMTELLKKYEMHFVASVADPLNLHRFRGELEKKPMVEKIRELEKTQRELLRRYAGLEDLDLQCDRLAAQVERWQELRHFPLNVEERQSWLRAIQDEQAGIEKDIEVLRTEIRKLQLRKTQLESDYSDLEHKLREELRGMHNLVRKKEAEFRELYMKAHN